MPKETMGDYWEIKAESSGDKGGDAAIEEAATGGGEESFSGLAKKAAGEGGDPTALVTLIRKMIEAC